MCTHTWCVYTHAHVCTRAGGGSQSMLLQCVVACRNVLQCVAVCCSVSQCVAVCCSAEHSSPFAVGYCWCACVLVCVSLSLSLSLPLSLPLSLFISICLCLCLCFYLCLCLCLCLCFCLHPCLCLRLYFCLHPCLCLRLCLCSSVYISVCMPLRVCVRVCVNVFRWAGTRCCITMVCSVLQCVAVRGNEMILMCVCFGMCMCVCCRWARKWHSQISKVKCKRTWSLAMLACSSHTSSTHTPTHWVAGGCSGWVFKCPVSVDRSKNYM